MQRCGTLGVLGEACLPFDQDFCCPPQVPPWGSVWCGGLGLWCLSKLHELDTGTRPPAIWPHDFVESFSDHVPCGAVGSVQHVFWKSRSSFRRLMTERCRRKASGRWSPDELGSDETCVAVKDVDAMIVLPWLAGKCQLA